MIPEKIRWIGNINPLGLIIEQTRNVLIKGEGLDVQLMITLTLGALLWCEASIRVLKVSSKKLSDLI